jgi:hypothetical protein
MQAIFDISVSTSPNPAVSLRSFENIRRLHAIPLLQEVIIEVKGSGLNHDMREEIKDYGWKITCRFATEYVTVGRR